ncbi:hypothetical protein [Phyllobacterium sp. OV277]|uniref:hypothetical protein n=1 Tax=Phyllobacterium sp. OV277 TaxID=1882772 RepID=UPI00088F7D3E|nr:hypothetical protein [Phyllobacterium sp. OV277]SDP07808.1 hypothetical protein SAMN05443582_103342 [Phyllobacterium sp. OV277]
MKIAFVLYAATHNIKKYFGETKLGMVPKEIREKYNIDYKFFTYPDKPSEDKFIADLVKQNEDYAFVALTEKNLQSLDMVGVPFSLLELGVRTIAAELSRLITFWTKRIHAVAKTFEPMGNRKALLLPLKNFVDEEASNSWKKITTKFSDRTFQFAVELEALLKHLRMLEFPKKRGSYNDKYFVDARGYHFSYGHEIHAKQETEGGNHNLQCLVSAKLRLGLPYCNERHYNVSLGSDGSLHSHKFIGCHGNSVTAGNCEHLNMFPNDYVV